MRTIDKLDNGHITEADLRALRDPSVAFAIGVPGGRGYVELLAVDGERIVASDALEHTYEISVDQYDTDHPQDRIIRNFFARQSAYMSRT